MSENTEKQTNETTGRLGIRREPLMVPVCDECGGQLKHGFRIRTVECANCGKIWEDEPVMQDFRP